MMECFKEGRKEMFYLTTHTFYLRLHGVGECFNVMGFRLVQKTNS